MAGYVLYKERSRHSPPAHFCQNGRGTLPDFMEKRGPYKSEDRKRTIAVVVMLTPDEKETMNKATKEEKKTISQYVRTLLNRDWEQKGLA